MTYLDSKNEKLIKQFVETHLDELADPRINSFMEGWEERYSDRSEDIFFAVKQLSLLIAKNQYTKVPAKKLGKMLAEAAQDKQYDTFKKKLTEAKVRTEENTIRAILTLLGDDYWQHKDLIIRFMYDKFYLKSESKIYKKFEQAKVDLKLEKFEKKVTAGRNDKITLEAIDAMTGVEFELFLKGYFEREGFQVSTTPKSGDQGADLILKKLGEKTCVQSKRYTGSVGNDAIQEVVGSLKYYSADKAIVITNSAFTAAAKKLAAANRVELWDRSTLRRLI